MTTATQQLHWEDVVEGQDIPSFSRTTGFMEGNRFAAANEEHVSFHMDHKAGEAMGAPGAFGMGNLRFAYLHNMLEDWIGADGAIKKVGVQYRDRNFEGETLTAWGKVVRTARKPAATPPPATPSSPSPRAPDRHRAQTLRGRPVPTEGSGAPSRQPPRPLLAPRRLITYYQPESKQRKQEEGTACISVTTC
ncbi:MAG: hypothetical protein NTZ05_19750 [Chloroflexi bacterium]|nr:hypothetical protein [Chloroflexota bacterium]